ncbi:hypothetical protein [Novosphingobium gossypii]|uniref:hypothetical protein n=1 Tax=Novosphingobium gossypii TaxID=1604774 RepID=UPI003D1954D8
MTSEPVRELTAIAGLPSYIARRGKMGDALCIDVHPRMGMGALIAKALLFHEMADRAGLKPEIVSTNSLYLSPGSSDVLADYFTGRPTQVRSRPLSGKSYMWALRHGAPLHMPLDRAAQLFATHFNPAPAIVEQVDKVLQGRSSFDLSIHFRGTDKVLESGTPDMDRALQHIGGFLDGTRGKDVFLATDDNAFRRVLTTRYPQHTFSSYDLSVLPDDTPRHFSAMSARDKAVESLVNIFLLARSPVIVRSSSYMSAISVLANPAMKTITLNKTLTGRQIFPEHEIIEAEQAAGGPQR